MTSAEALAIADERRQTWRIDLAIAATFALLYIVFHAFGGFATIANFRGDNDNLMRLVQVRDLLAGQGWFDLHQYRMGPEGGFVMHWSRLVDAPIAFILLAAGALTGSPATAETTALVLWPALLLLAALFLLLRSVRLVGGDAAVLPAVVVGGAAFHFIGLFVPGALDHHNVQLVLTLAMLAGLLGASENPWGGALAGGAAALMLAVGMETAPYVAIGGLVAALGMLGGQPEGRRTAAGFGLTFAAVAGLAFVATVPPGAWGSASCDGYSVAQFAVAALAGAGLACVAALPLAQRSLPHRLGGLLVLGLAVAGLVLAAFPQCLSDPYAGLDPRLKTYWLSAVTEAQPLTAILRDSISMAASYYATPLVALVVSVVALGRGGRKAWVVAAFLGGAVLVSVWQVRGAMFAIPIATVPLAAWIGGLRSQAAATPSAGRSLAMVAGWLLSFNVLWALAASAVFPADDDTAAGGDETACQVASDYDRLAALPASGVLAVSNLGAPVLRFTPHRVLAGPYHRNIDGNLMALSAFMDEPTTARTIARSEKLEFVAFCRGNGESAKLAEWAPDGLMALLMSGQAPLWLEPLPGNDGAVLALYRVSLR